MMKWLRILFGILWEICPFSMTVSYLYQYELMDIYSTLGIIIEYSFVAQTISKFDPWERFYMAPVPLWPHTPLPFMEDFPTFCHLSRCTRLICIFSVPVLRVRHFSQEPWFFLLDRGVRNQDLGARYARYFRFWDHYKVRSLIHIMVTIGNNIVLYIWQLLRQYILKVLITRKTIYNCQGIGVNLLVSQHIHTLLCCTP